MIDSEKKFRYDICRAVGHELEEYSYICNRCEYNVFAKQLEERLATQFIGRKITSETPRHIQAMSTHILNEFINDGTIISFKNIDVEAYVVGQIKISFDVGIPQCYDTLHMQIYLQ